MSKLIDQLFLPSIVTLAIGIALPAVAEDPLVQSDQNRNDKQEQVINNGQNPDAVQSRQDKGQGQDQARDKDQAQNDQNDVRTNPAMLNKTLFYAFIEEDPAGMNGPAYDLLKDKAFFKDLIVPHNENERKFRPMLQWRAWANQRQKFLPSLLFLGFFSFLGWWLIPSRLSAAAKECRSDFWKSVGTGILLGVLTVTANRTIFLTEIGWPLGILIAGAFQGAMLAGLAVAVFILGNSVNALIRLHKLPLIAAKPTCSLNCDLITGSVLSALILQIPQLGDIPRIGTRLLALFALLGLGALYRQYRAKTGS